MHSNNIFVTTFYFKIKQYIFPVEAVFSLSNDNFFYTMRARQSKKSPWFTESYVTILGRYGRLIFGFWTNLWVLEHLFFQHFIYDFFLKSKISLNSLILILCKTKWFVQGPKDFVLKANLEGFCTIYE